MQSIIAKRTDHLSVKYKFIDDNRYDSIYVLWCIKRVCREKSILAKLSKMDQWTAELNTKIEKKKIEMENARKRKERLVEEVRRHFGFNISPHDARFKEMIEQKEKEEKKKKKEAKKKAKFDRLTLMVHQEIKGISQEETTKKEDDKDSKTSTK